MNERIRELHKKVLDESENMRWNIEDAEKFAELIIRECATVVQETRWYGESPSNGWRNPIRHVCTVMKEHFGIEE